MSLDISTDNLSGDEIQKAEALEQAAAEAKKEIKADEKADEIETNVQNIPDISETVSKAIKAAAVTEKNIKKNDAADHGSDADDHPEHTERTDQNTNSLGLLYVVVSAALVIGTYALYKKRKPAAIAAMSAADNEGSHYTVPNEVDGVASLEGGLFNG